MFGVKFVTYPASIMYLCQMYLMTAFKISRIEYQPIYRMLEFSYFQILVLALDQNSLIHQRPFFKVCYNVLHMLIMFHNAL